MTNYARFAGSVATLCFATIASCDSVSEFARPPHAPDKLTTILSVCLLPGDQDAQIIKASCGSIDVPEDYGAPSGPQISLNVVVVPAKKRDADGTPVFYLEGGPGGGSTVFARTIIEYVLPTVHETRDIVFIDQRGSGKSNPLLCPPKRGPLQSRIAARVDIDNVTRCLDALKSQARLSFYSTEHASMDMEHVRRELGYQKVNLFGSSYGTRLALVHMKNFPETVRSSVLVSVLPIDAGQPETTALDTEMALRKVIEKCASDALCNKSYPKFRNELDQLTARLRKEPQLAVIADPETGNDVDVEIDTYLFARSIRGMLYFPEDAASIPSVTAQAYRGDLGYFANDALEIVKSYEEEGFADGLYNTVTCSEDFDYANLDRAETLSDGTLLGDWRIRNFEDICAIWPRAILSADFFEPARTSIPTLIFSGELDPVTPPYFAERVAETLPNSRHLTVENQGHNVTDAWPGCATEIVADFFDDIDLRRVNPSCLNNIPPLNWTLPDAMPIAED